MKDWHQEQLSQEVLDLIKLLIENTESKLLRKLALDFSARNIATALLYVSGLLEKLNIYEEVDKGILLTNEELTILAYIGRLPKQNMV